MIIQPSHPPILPCECGNEHLIIWWPHPFDMHNMEKIECDECGNIVYGSDEDSIADWNEGRYDQ